MTSDMPSHTTSGQIKRTSFSGFTGNNTSLFLDRAKPGIRGSTPDSEALASSDDEPDHLHRLQTVTSNPGHKPARRASWFTESQQGLTRKASIGGSGPFSPVSPGTTATPGDQAPWNTNAGQPTGSTIGRGHSNSASFPWSNTIWNTDSQKGPPQRLTEVLPSPTTLVPPVSTNTQQDDNPIRSPPLNRDQARDSTIPFSIPLQPTLKSYRSQSYSVGQIDPESAINQPGAFGIPGAYASNRRGTAYAPLHRRPSRPSMLADTTHDPNGLGQLREVEDDEESSGGSTSGFQCLVDGTRTVEDIVGENAMLRQQLAANQRVHSRNARVANSAQRPQSSSQFYHQRLRDSMPEDAALTEYDVNDPEQYDPQKASNPISRRFSEYGTQSGPHYALGVNADNKILDSVRRGQWQSSLGFARVEEPPQSRRHSFAEMPTRNNSMGSTEDNESLPPLGDFGHISNERAEISDVYGDSIGRPSHGDTVGYFSQTAQATSNGHDLPPSTTGAMHRAYAQHHIDRTQHMAPGQNRPSQLLYIVTFKCLRADVFYVQEGTGLRVKKGDLVIVEADRGTDLGTVQTDETNWADAKRLKEIYTKKHHEWLMAFSHHTQNGTVAGPNPNGPPLSHAPANTSSTSTFQDLPSGEIKPKMIKRLAQTHEIATLREKEGGEAKAKRMCQQKVVDHRLSMEILDAEFQMDWKKLTFYYFADSYINFNPLVTDLFKVYKTRIWMSAINTAAIASPPSGSRTSVLTPRNVPNHDYGDYRTAQYAHSGGAAAPHMPITGFNNMYDPGRNGMMMGGMAYDQEYPQSVQSHGFETRHMSPFPLEYRAHGQQAVNLPSPFGPSAAYASHLHHASSFTSQPDSNHEGHHGRQLPTGDWTQSFEGLSLGR